MPSYDMLCQECGHKFSVFCTISQKERQVCPQCQSSKISQRFTSVNIGGSKGSGGSCSASSCSGCSGC
ncbi:zinc ribbon domain-containing protein [Desulfosporosinus sp. PR]|uniref:FmdB family zinc ribbon protein n=1 Tax=Candidatus Desulfosporosinus nitrosoreducens TaxID=3401928 RepID=UPI0027F9DDB7|nr:zinc ribbon domain-containing protein [Desulfosporosinus sp. PR]MDQ7095113.1 zinc ribbon domain-containing protein [Desulfosporosinus sp. PR]